MVTVTMAMAAIPIHVATRAGWIPEGCKSVNDGDGGVNDGDGDGDDGGDGDAPARGGEEMEQEVRSGEQAQECSS